MKNRFFPETLGVGLLFVIGLSSCRLGNHSDTPQYTQKSQFTNQELFFTEVKGFETYAFYVDGTHTSNLQSPLVSVPVHLLNTFTNPVYWDTLSDATKTQVFMDTYQSEFEQTQVDASGNISVEIDSDVRPLITNSACLTQLKTVQGGSLDRSAPGTTTLPSASTRSTVAGKLKLDYTAYRVIQGDCADSLRELAACYQNGAGCSNEQLAEAHELFDLYVRGSGVLNIQDAAKIKGLVYVVHFD